MDNNIINENHEIRITKFDEPFIPDWIYNADTIPATTLKMLISDGVKHSYKELYAIFGDFIDKPKSFTKLLDIADAMLFEDKRGYETFVMAKTLTASQERFGQCVQKIIDMYEKDECHLYQEILNGVRDIMPSEYTIDQVLEDAKLILYLRNRSIKGSYTTSRIDDSGERISYGENMAIREPSEGKGRFDLITPFGLERLAKWYELGAKKYSDRNWEKGIPFSRYFDSAMRHMSKFIMGRTDEDHLAAAVWNLMAIMHHQELGQTELDDLPHYIKEDRDA